MFKTFLFWGMEKSLGLAVKMIELSGKFFLILQKHSVMRIGNRQDIFPRRQLESVAGKDK